MNLLQHHRLTIWLGLLPLWVAAMPPQLAQAQGADGAGQQQYLLITPDCNEILKCATAILTCLHKMACYCGVANQPPATRKHQVIPHHNWLPTAADSAAADTIWHANHWCSTTMQQK